MTDPYLDPPGNDRWYTEESVRLPASFWCYEGEEEPAVGTLPSEANGFVTFGCLNSFTKVNERVLRPWAAVLRRVEDSRLVLMAPTGGARDRVLRVLGEEGIEAGRVAFTGFLPRPEYLRKYRQIDIGLDTFPYNGHTTSLDALWMGVPVVTLVGEAAVGRAGWSQLNNMRLTELAASTGEEFVGVAVGLARDVARLRELRMGLRERIKASPLTDARGFARGIEAAYRMMWRRWCESGE